MVEYTWRHEEFIEILKDVFLRLNLKGKGGNQSYAYQLILTLQLRYL